MLPKNFFIRTSQMLQPQKWSVSHQQFSKISGIHQRFWKNNFDGFNPWLRSFPAGLPRGLLWVFVQKHLSPQLLSLDIGYWIFFILHSTFRILNWTFWIGHSTLDILHWTFYIGYSTFDIQHWTFYIEYSTLDILHWTFFIGHSTLNIQHWTFYIEYSTLDILHWIFFIGYFTLNIQPSLLS